jgi:capsular polysaccharide biosynthesis protein
MSLREEFRSRERPLPDLEAEREVDVGQAARQVAARWWLLVAGLVAGMVVGYLVALGGGDFYKAEATLYLGQPFSPTAQAPVPSLATNPTAVGQAIRSEDTLQEAAGRSGMAVSDLRGNVSTSTVSGISARRTPGVTPLVEVSVQGERRRDVARAANALASIVVDDISGYVDRKIESLEERIASDERDLRDINARLAIAQRQLNEALAGRSLPVLERFLLVTNYNSSIGFTEQRRATVQQDLLDARQLLALAEDVERPRIYQRAVAVETSARSTRNSVIVGGLIGLILGAFAALLWEPVLERRIKRARR